MGYYTGNGVTSGGSSTPTLVRTGPDVGGAYYVYQRINSTVTRKSGVSLSDAKAVIGDLNMNYWVWPGGRAEPGCRGTRSQVSYSQIGDSKLYELSITEETIQVRGKQGSYDSGWVS